MTATTAPRAKPLDPAKFRDPDVTAKGERRASVELGALRTLWFNTGTLCNLTCRNCYIESSPTNDRLEYLTAAEARAYLDEIAADGLPTEEIGFTGGEPFMNPDIIAMLDEALGRGFRVLVLTNAMKPMMKRAAELLALRERFADRLTIRVSLDHYAPALHQIERGPRSWQPAMEGIDWLVRHGFTLHVAGRTVWSEDEASLRHGYARMFAERGIPLDAANPAHLVLFPEMDAGVDVPEITTACWGILHRSPDAMMCASSRMVVKRRGTERPAVVACTLLPYDPQFEFGATLAEAAGATKLNHPHCARFCVLGGASCSAGNQPP
ncbi:MAG: radical SAM protein [Alphaproteobacteria bacterium]|nr:radical SAM protein [Alphaproteobacteria bacterium]